LAYEIHPGAQHLFLTKETPNGAFYKFVCKDETNGKEFSEKTNLFSFRWKQLTLKKRDIHLKKCSK